MMSLLDSFFLVTELGSCGIVHWLWEIGWKSFMRRRERERERDEGDRPRAGTNKRRFNLGDCLSTDRGFSLTWIPQGTTWPPIVGNNSCPIAMFCWSHFGFHTYELGTTMKVTCSSFTPTYYIIVSVCRWGHTIDCPEQRWRVWS